MDGRALNYSSRMKEYYEENKDEDDHLKFIVEF